MKISVRNIPPAGLEFRNQVEPADIGLTKEDLDVVAPLDVSATIERILNAVTVRARVTVRHAGICSRCLERIEHEQSQNYTFSYMLEDGVHDIDLGDDIRQELILEESLKTLCRDDCKGLCQKCGINLNTQSCTCET